jgi:hypothetical protein
MNTKVVLGNYIGKAVTNLGVDWGMILRWIVKIKMDCNGSKYD